MFGIGHWELLCIAITLLLLGGVAILIVVALTKGTRQSRPCPGCGNPVVPPANFCPHCGKPMA